LKQVESHKTRNNKNSDWPENGQQILGEPMTERKQRQKIACAVRWANLCRR